MSVPAAHRIIATAGGIAGACSPPPANPPGRRSPSSPVSPSAWSPSTCASGASRPRSSLIGTIAAVVVAAITSARDETWAPLVHAAAGATLVGAAFLVVHLVQPRSLGFGDVRLAALTGALTAYGTASITDRGRRRGARRPRRVHRDARAARAKSAPFAPYLLAASAVAVLVSIRQ